MNKRTEQTRWTPKRLLSLLMALIMTLLGLCDPKAPKEEN